MPIALRDADTRCAPRIALIDAHARAARIAFRQPSDVRSDRLTAMAGPYAICSGYVWLGD